ncbi:MAG TPA: hypothetical protein VKF59_01275 [Candidatus Dormibacteraeota bacterium]|nr:hypothetical protein [Candidatus Dormibacteraeota bacterium]
MKSRSAAVWVTGEARETASQRSGRPDRLKCGQFNLSWPIETLKCRHFNVSASLA